MANEQFPADWAVSLPNLYPTPGESMQQGIALKERQVERKFAYDQQEKLRKETQAKNNRLFNLKEIEQETDASKYKTGEQAFDAYSQNELKALKDKFLTEYVDLDPVEVEARIGSDMNDFLRWHSAAQLNVDKIKAQLTDANKTLPNLDLSMLHDAAFNKLANDYIRNGERVDPTFVNPNRNYVGEELTNDNLGKYINDTSALDKYIYAMNPQEYGGKEYTDKRGYKHNYAYTAGLTKLTDFTYDENGKPTGVELKHETMDVTDANGNPTQMKLLPSDITKDLLESNNEVRGSALGLWAKAKPNIEAKVKASGQKITPAVEDVLFRKFMYDYVKANHLDQSYFKETEGTATPRLPSQNTNIFIGQQQQPFNPETSGTEFDRIGSVNPISSKRGIFNISNGVVRDKDGNLYSGEGLTLISADLPGGLKAVLKSSGIDYGDARYWNVKVKDGRIEAIKPTNGSWIDRQDMFNYQLKSNTESMKGVQPEYGNKNLKPTTKKGELD